MEILFFNLEISYSSIRDNQRELYWRKSSIFSTIPKLGTSDLIFLLTLWQMRIYATIVFFFLLTIFHEWASNLNFTSKYIWCCWFPFLISPQIFAAYMFKARCYQIVAVLDKIWSFQGQVENLSWFSVTIHNCLKTVRSAPFITCAITQAVSPNEA